MTSLIEAMHAARAAEVVFNRWPQWKRELPVWSGASASETSISMQITVDINAIKQQCGPHVATELVLAELGSHYPFPLIALCGPAGCGKSTVARSLDSEKLQVRNFAGPLKRMLVVGLGLTEAQIDGGLKETPSALLCGHTPRYAMQKLGTEWGRDLLGPDLWVNATLANLAPAPTVTIIDDCRFANEAAAVRARGGVVIELSRAGVTYSATHASEAGVPRELIDATVVNEGETADVAVAVLCKALEIVQARKPDLASHPKSDPTTECERLPHNSGIRRVRAIDAGTLREWGLRHSVDYPADSILRQHQIGMDRFECVGSIVFKAPDDGKLYYLTYEYNDEAGWCPLDEEDRLFECREVVAAEKTVTAYYFADGKEAE